MQFQCSRTKVNYLLEHHINENIGNVQRNVNIYASII